MIYGYDFNPTYMEGISSASWETVDPSKHVWDQGVRTLNQNVLLWNAFLNSMEKL